MAPSCCIAPNRSYSGHSSTIFLHLCAIERFLCGCSRTPLSGEPPPRIPRVLRFVPFFFSPDEPALKVSRAPRFVISLGRLRAPLSEGEHRVENVHVGLQRLPGERLGSPLLLVLLLDEVLGQGPVAPCLAPEVVDYPIEEVLGELGVELLGRNRAVGEGLVGLPDRLGELLGRQIHLLLLLPIHHHPFSMCQYCKYRLFP